MAPTARPASGSDMTSTRALPRRRDPAAAALDFSATSVPVCASWSPLAIHLCYCVRLATLVSRGRCRGGGWSRPVAESRSRPLPTTTTMTCTVSRHAGSGSIGDCYGQARHGKVTCRCGCAVAMSHRPSAEASLRERLGPAARWPEVLQAIAS
jgi:hypothetical protein